MTKEQFLSIRASWKTFIAEGKHKKYKQEYKVSARRLPDGSWEDIMSHYWESNLKDVHHFIYTVIRKRDLEKAFTGNAITIISENIKSKIQGYERYPTEHYCNNVIIPLLAPFGEQFKFEDLKALFF